ncbi:tetratricopeptide repeat protein [Streptomyces sp. NPDC127098]|uniref:tetratricopeptide repeat protein n=1 Tax=Streptomyces sp. NPDC127098 TaxID=3347137 RepID=UPI00365C0CA2
MAERRLSRQELNRQRRRSGFIGREEQLDVFRRNLGRDPESPDFRYLFHVHGNGGVGKTSLIRQWEQQARERGAATAIVGDEVHDVVEAMAAVADRLEHEGLPLDRFRKRLKEYRQRRHEVERGQAAAEPAADVPSVGGMVTAQVGLAAAGAVPLLGAVTGVMDPTTAALGVDRIRSWASARLRAPEDVQLVLSPVKQLTPVFLTDLAEAARQRPLLVLFFDVYERLGPLLDGWLRQVIQEDTHGVLEANVVVVLSGQGRLDPRHWADWASEIAEVPLDVFSEQEARDLLTARGVTDPETVEVILRLSGRLPVLLDMLAHTRPTVPGEVVDPAETAVERFLKWEHDQDRRAATLACALPLHLDEDIYRALAPEGAAEQYPWLRGLPFMGHHDGHHRYHDTVRALMLRHQRLQYPGRWAAQQATLADLYGKRSEALEADLTPHRDRGYWDSERWREARQDETYHRLCANPAAALAAAVADTVRVCHQGTSALRQWVQMFEHAWRDTDAAELAHWARRLKGAVESEQPLERTFTLLVSASELNVTHRAAALVLRGRQRYNQSEYEAAIEDYDEALRLVPDSAWALAHRGETHRVLGHHEEALRDLDRAVELDADDLYALESRGSALGYLGRYEEALRDLDRVIEQGPRRAWDYAERGRVHHRMRRYDAAVADYDKAIELAPDDAWIHRGRGDLHVSAGRFEEAVRDFDRAIELEPYEALGWAFRGAAHRHAGRLDLAVADLDRALELDDDEWTYAERGEAHRLAGRLEAAVADFGLAIALDPQYFWALWKRGDVHRQADRYREAVRDYGRAIQLDSGTAWLYERRAKAHHLAGDYVAAVVDFGEAIRLDPAQATVYAGRGHCHLATGDYDVAISDYDAALRLGTLDENAHNTDTTYTWVLIRRGEARLLSGAAEAARGDLAESLDRTADHAWAHIISALIARQLGDAEEGAHWRRAHELLMAEGGDVDLGNLVLLHCMRPDPEAAGRALDRFLAAPPEPWMFPEMLNILERYERAGLLDPDALAGPRGRLREAYAAVSSGGAGR